MGILPHLLAGTIHLAIVAIDICVMLYIVHVLAARWPSVPFFQSADRLADPPLQELWRLIDRSKGSHRLPLFWESFAGAMFPAGLLLFRMLLAVYTCALFG